jgi:WD40 repeat protein/serine/threonine protein kinase/tetratricopeptide (TPR) repeat protein
MTPELPTEYEQLSPEVVARIDATCDGFEQAWKATRTGGAAPRIASYLDGCGDPERPHLLRELMALDRAYRERFGMPTPPEESGAAAGPPAVDDSPTHVARAGGSSAPRQSWPSIPGLELVEVLGSGGMGVVFKARQPALDRVVAVKLLRDTLLAEPSLRARFHREARAIAQLQHPHLVQVFEFGEVPGAGAGSSQPYLVLEYVSGGSLADLVRGKPQPPREAARLVETLAGAIDYAHQQGILHRDLKPANILLSFSREPAASASFTLAAGSRLNDCVPKITDFGLAKSLEDSGARHTRTGEFLGTPSYMSPEQIEGPRAQVGPGADIYGLGAVLYEMLTGRPPFLGETALDTLRQVQNNEPVAPSRLQPGCPRDLDTIVLKCLSKDAGRRYASAAALADDLRRFREGVPILARPTRWPEHLAKWARRRPAVAGLLAGLALVTILGLAGILWQWRRADREREEAVRLGNLEAAARTDAEAQLYASQISQAYLDWGASRSLVAERLLDACWQRNPQQCLWEWHYLKRQCQAHLRALVGHTQPINTLAYSPDGKWLASGGGHWNAEDPGEVMLWDPRAGKLLHKLSGPAATVHRVAFHPHDGSLAAACMDGTVYRWDLRRPDRPLPLQPLKYGSRIYSLAFHPDGRALATCHANGVVQVRDLQTLQVRGRWHENTSNVFDVAFSPDGKYLASANKAGTVIVLATATYRPCYRLYHRGDARRVVFSPDSRILASASWDGALILWDMGDRCARLLTHHLGEGNVQNIAFGPNSQTLVCATRNTGVRVWYVRGQRELLPIGPVAGVTYSMAYSPDACFMATAKDDNVIRIWDLLADEEPRTLNGHETWITGMALSPDGKTLALAGGRNWSYATGTKTIRIFDIPSLSRQGADLIGHTSWLTCVAFHPQGEQLASGDRDGLAIMWDLKSRRMRATLKGHTAPVLAVAYSPDGRTLATAGADQVVRFWDVTSARERARLSHPAGVHALAYSSDGRLLATGGADRLVRVWDTATGRLLKELPGHGACVSSTAFCPDSHVLVSADHDHELRFWDGDTGRNLSVQAGSLATAVRPAPNDESHSAPLSERLGTCLTFSPDGRRLVFAAAGWPVQLWDVSSRRPIVALGELDPVFNVNAVFSKDGRRLLITYRWSLKIWDSRPVDAQARADEARKRASAWHEQRTLLNLGFREWFTADFHATRVLQADPQQALWLARRAMARMGLGNVRGADADHAAAVALGRAAGDIRQLLWPGTAATWDQRGEGLAYARQWGSAAEAYRAAILRDPRNVDRWYNLAIARLAQGNVAAYRTACREILRRFAASDAEVTGMVVFAVAPLRDGGDPEALFRLASRFAQASPANARAYGAACYRSGRYQDALQTFASYQNTLRPRAWDMLFRAMTLHRLGEAKRARAWLESAHAWIAEADRVEASPIGWSDSARWAHWNEEIEVKSLLAEATALIGEVKS